MTSFIKALLLVVVAEMGDKTQLLAMAMVSKYKAKQVLLGVLIATILNHALAVAVGSYLSSVIPMDLVKIIAALSFLAFGLWTIRGDKLDDEENKKVKFGPIITVAIAFFLAEMGDKTQLMTITIAAENQQPLFILMGTTVGMLIADGIVILGGAWMCKHIPDIYKMGSWCNLHVLWNINFV
ncbi:putative Ca2+/H+ antiporter (TMEM165/GDT1 family) [Clostridium beijerinckii]|nr:putative Ca2+/H+ antiporter (TMEM165/GDT1 family) [Clostridium beijerinckii]